MQSKKYKIVPAKKAKNIAVIGGGIGGMEVARVATMRGHKVTIYEKSDDLGGIFVAAASPSFKEKDKELIAWYKKQIKDLGIEVKYNTEVKDVNALGADEVVIATGAVARRFNVQGIERAIEACDFLLDKKEVGDNVVVVGGGLTGCEIAYELDLRGKKPTIVEMKNDLIAVRGVCLANSSYLREYFALHKVPVHLETRLLEITQTGVKVQKGSDVFEIPADSVIMSVGYIPAPVAEGSKHVHVVGDSAKVGNLRTVIWGAWDVAMKL